MADGEFHPSRIESVQGYRQPRRVRQEAAPEAVLEGAFDAGALDGFRPASLDTYYPDAATAAFGTDPADARAIFEVVLGKDDRTVVSNTRQPPWRMIAALRIHTPTGRVYCGTGWLIGPQTLMTAGHCVYIHDEGGWPTAIEVLPALNGATEPYERLVSKPGSLHASKAWIDARERMADYGAITLPKRLGDQLGWFGFGALADAQLKDATLNIAGYPVDRDNATRQYFHARVATKVEPRVINYDIDTHGGQSGSPVWVNQGEKRIAVGIHTTGSSFGNSGTRINQQVYADMLAWRK